jgi:hypothetical protein
VLLALTVVLTSFSLLAQDFRATISGRVFDSSGAAVPNAKVVAVNQATNETSTATTDSSGAYTIPLLRPGNYNITGSSAGFKQQIRENVVLQVSQTVGIDITLEVGQMTESVRVEANAAVLETQTASRVGVIDNTKVTELPLNARNPFMLGTTQSGVTFRGAAIWQRPFDNGAIAEWSVNGGQQSRNEFLVDGAPNNAQLGGNNIAYVPIVDAVQEFSIVTNSYDAQYGRTGGGVFNVAIKSGSNQHHITLWEFLRRTGLNANTFQNNAIGRPRADMFLDQYGWQFDGPVYFPKLLKKDAPVKLFYLGSYEGYREGSPNPLRNSFAQPEMREGDFSRLVQANGQPVTIYDPFSANPDNRTPFAGNRIPGNRINPVARNVTKFMPVPNATTPGQRYSTTNFLIPEYFNNDKFYSLILKFDWNFGDKHRSFIRHMSNDRTEERCANGICAGPGMDGQQPFQRINDAYALDWVTTLNSSTIFNIRGSYNRFIEKGFGRDNIGFDLTSLGLPASLVSQLPQPAYFGRWNFAGYSPLGRGQGINITNNYSLSGTLTKIVGAHTMKMGADIRRIHFIQQNSGDILQFNFDDSWTRRIWNQAEASAGDSYASFLLGLPGGGQSFYPLFPFYRNWYSAFFFQDDWKVNRRLTLNIGLRYDVNIPADEKYNRLNRGFDPAAVSPVRSQISAANRALYPQLGSLSGGLNFAGVNGLSRNAGDLYRNTWQPRIGFAYQLNEKMVLRGGYGRYYMNPSNNNLRSIGFQTETPLVTSLDAGRTPIPNLLSNPYPNGIATPSGAGLGASTFLGRDFQHWSTNFRLPNIDQFSLGVQYQVNRGSVLDISYVGSRTNDHETEIAANIPNAAFLRQCDRLQGGDPAICNAQVPNPFLGLEAFRGTPFFTATSVTNYQMNRPFPQFNGNLTQQGLNTGFIRYNSLQVNYNVRMGGLNLITNYTWSKMLENWGFQDVANRVRQQGLYFNDRTHFFKFTGVYDLPFGKGKRFGNSSGWTDKLIGGWQATGFFTYASGEPADFPGNVLPLGDPRNTDINWNQHQVRGVSNCVLRQNDNGTVTPMPYSVASGCGNDFSQYKWLWVANFSPGQGIPGRQNPNRWGNLRKHTVPTLDASLLKTTRITERLRFQFGIEAFNAINRFYYGRNDGFNNNPNDANFGTVFPALASNQNSNPRAVQLRFKILW